MAIAFGKLKSKLGMDDILPFGRHQGYTVEEILKDRPEYIAWLMENTSLKFYKSVQDEVIRIACSIKSAYRPKRNMYGWSDYDNELDALQQDQWDGDVPF